MNVYRITTEGDCEGRSVKSLGYWTGDLETILLHLADKAGYALDVQLLTPEEVQPQSGHYLPTKKEVHFRYSGEFNHSTSTLTKSNYYNAKKLTVKGPMPDKLALDKIKALSKLTSEEKKLLGLK